MECNIKIIINGEVVKTVHSDEELDNWIIQNKEQLSDGVKHGFQKIFAINNVEETFAKLSKVESKHSEFLKNQNKDGFVSCAVTTFWNLFGGALGAPLINPFSGEKIEHIIKPTDVGTYTDEILSRQFEGKTQKQNYPNFSPSIQQYLVGSIAKEVIPAIQKLGIKVSNWEKQIKVQFGMSTNSFQDYILKEIENSAKTFESGKEGNRIKRAANLIRYISGIADIIVIDDDGIAHVGDIKTWHSTPVEAQSGNNFMLEQHADYIAQVTTYKEILRQYGVPIGQGFLIVYETDYTDNNEKQHVKLNSVKFNSVVRVPNVGKYQDAVRNALWKETTVTDGIMKKVGDVLNELFPTTNISKELKAKELDYEFMKGAIRKVDKEKDPTHYNAGDRYFFVKKRSVIGSPKNIPVYGKTEAELIQDTVGPNGQIIKSPFKEYIDLLNKKKATRFTNLAKDVMDAMTSHNLDTLDDVFSSIAPGNRDTLIHHFKRFVLCNWKFKENPVLNANGIYVFEKDDYLEVVVLDEENLINQRINLLHGDSILGTFVKNSSLTDDRVVMRSDYGNLMLMKACALISLDPELTRNKKILSIKALNLHNARVYEENNTRLIDNWNHLARLYNRNHTEKLGSLGYNTFVKDETALVHIADEFIECLWHISNNVPKLRYLVQDLYTQREITENYILDRIENLKKFDKHLRDFRKKDNSDPIWNAYAYLRKALLSLNKINMFQEKDLGSVLQGINTTGIRMRSFNSSSSPLARQMGEVMANFRSAVRLEFVNKQFTWSKLLDAAYKERNFNGVIGNDWVFFDSWFEKDTSGKIKPEFRLVRPENFRGGAAERKAYEYFLEMNAFYRWPDEDEREEHRGSDEWYEVPMIHAGFIEEFTGGQPLNAIKYKWTKLKDAGLAMIMGDEDIERTKRELDNIDVDKLPDVIRKDASSRDAYVEKYGIEGIEKNLDFVFLSMLYSGIRSEKSPMFCELFTSFLVVADYMMDVSGLDTNEIRKAMEDFIKIKLFGKDIRENKNLNALIGVLKGITATVALGWNTRAFFREILTGQKKQLNRWASKADEQKAKSEYRVWLKGTRNEFVKKTEHYFIRPEFLDYGEFFNAYVDVVGKIFDNMSIFGFYHQLNAIYGMVNFSNEEMAEASKRHQWTVLGLTDKSSVTATAPDFLHRMAILVGHLRTIGAFDAYYLDDDTGRLLYDMRKDARFQTWLKYKDSEDSIPDMETLRKFRDEKQKYEEELEAWKHVGFNLNYGDFLPQALSPTAALVVKEYADEQYGNYDEETKSLVQKQTLGSLFLQYKTYGLAQFALWFSEPTYTNTLSYIYVTDDRGVKMVEIPTITTEEYEKYRDHMEKPEDQVTKEEWERKGTRYIKQLSGDVFIGKAQTDYLLASKLFTLKGDEFLKLWNENPEFRSNLYISMLDLLEMALVGLLLRIFWDTEETPIARQDFLHRWTYGVLQGMSTDGPLLQTLSGIVGDGAPPVFGMVKGYYATFMSIINGNTNLLYGLTNTVGMTRELSNFFRSKQ